MESTSDQNMVFENDNVLRRIIIKQILRIIGYTFFVFLFLFVVYSVLIYIKVAPFLVIFFLSVCIMFFFRIENLRIFTLTNCLRILSKIGKENIKWGLQDDILKLKKSSDSAKIIEYSIKQLNCYFKDQVITIKPIVEIDINKIKELKLGDLYMP
ncbi:MAG: hypothetical protein ACRCXZ_00795 [Patescibacteria group bacterium]